MGFTHSLSGAECRAEGGRKGIPCSYGVPDGDPGRCEDGMSLRRENVVSEAPQVMIR